MRAWDAAGGPEHERDAALLTDGQLRIRLRAERDALGVRPPDTTPELRAAEIGREQARQDAAVAEREAELAADAAEAARLREQADQLRAEAELLALDVERAARGVEALDDWSATYGATLAEADLVRGEVEARGITLDQEEPDRRTAAEHLDDRAAVEAEDPHRAVTDADVRDDQAEAVDVPAAELDTLPEVPLLGSEVRRAALEAECHAMALRAADARSQDAHEPVDTSAQRRRRWVLDEAHAAATADAHGDYAAAGLD